MRRIQILRRRGRGGFPRRRLSSRSVSARAVAILAFAAGNLLVVPGAAGVLRDSTPPVVTPIIFGTLGANGWYTSNVTINWAIVDADSIILSTSGCDARTLTADTTGVTVACSATSAGGDTTVSKTIKLDQTPPSVSAVPARAPDANGWYNHPLAITFAGTDATSGIASCSSGSYAGPDNPSASVAGSCTDLAGNVGTASLSLKYDATPPAISQLRAKAGNHRIDLTWNASSDTQVVEVARSPGTKGATTTTLYQGHAASYRDGGLKVGARYQYTVTAFDQAGNTASEALGVTATGPLLNPVPGARVGSAPLLVWTAVKGARYYNLQLIRGHKILSIWPTSARFQLRRSWVFNGHRYRLRPGVYRWYVWPGFGPASADRYGRLLGRSSFVFSHT